MEGDEEEGGGLPAQNRAVGNHVTLGGDLAVPDSATLELLRGKKLSRKNESHDRTTSQAR